MKWLTALTSELRRVGHDVRKKELIIVFVDPREMKSINKQFRNKSYATDVLSFEPIDQSSLGELVLCPEVLRDQSLDTGLSYYHELGYMLVHGSLHLLGYDHETSKSDEKRMFQLQDKLFAKVVSSLGRARMSGRVR
jgi:probable rRNA maturation factor